MQVGQSWQNIIEILMYYYCIIIKFYVIHMKTTNYDTSESAKYDIILRVKQ